jgi:hypothetical protein
MKRGVSLLSDIRAFFALDARRIANGRLRGNHNEVMKTRRLLALKVTSDQCEPGGSNGTGE